MEPALPLPLRLELSHAPVPLDHAAVSDSIATFLASYAARTGTSNPSASDDPSASATGSGSTGGVLAAQLTRLMNGLAGKIDYDAFTSLLTASSAEGETPQEVLEPETPIPMETDSLQATQQSVLEAEAQDDPEASPKKKSKKDKKEKKDKKVKPES